MTTTRDNRFYPGYHSCFLTISRACLNQYYKLLMILLDQQQRRNENPINPSWHKSWVAQFGPQGVPSSLTPDIFLVLLFSLFPTGSLAPSQKSQKPIYILHLHLASSRTLRSRMSGNMYCRYYRNVS